jgi:Uma2 family endonuclease
MGESPEQHDIINMLISSFRELARARGWSRVYIGGDAFFAWRKGHPLVRVSPDVYLLDDAPKKRGRSWQTWRPGVNPPRFAVEIVSVNWKKDYDDAPQRYASLGCSELVVFDAEAAQHPRTARRRVISVYRRTEDGAFALTYAGNGPAWCTELNAALVPQIVDGNPRLRVALDAEGHQIVETEAERATREAERATREAERATREAERATREAEGRAGAEREIARLKATIAKLRRRTSARSTTRK